MRWITNKDQHAYMKQRQVENLARYSAAEDWAWSQIRTVRHSMLGGLGWTRQAVWGCRIFDFWCDKLGLAVEIDGPEHDAEYDSIRDRYNYYRSGIVVLRVRNFNEEDMQKAIKSIQSIETKKDRVAKIKADLGVAQDFPMKKVPDLVGLKLAHGAWSSAQRG